MIRVENALLAPHTNYSVLIQKLIKAGVNLKSISHITGGGLVDNVTRVIPKEFSLNVNINSWPKIPIFDFLSNNLDIKNEDLYQTFNMGIGLVLIVDRSEKNELLSLVGGKNCSEIGTVIEDNKNLVYLND